MSAEKLYKIVEKEGSIRGKVMIAEKDMLPGQELLVEAPLMFYEDSLLQQCIPLIGENCAGLIAAYIAFRKTTLENQQKFLNLYGPMKSQSDFLVLEQKDLFMNCLQALEGDNLFTDEMFDIFHKVACVYKYNIFGLDHNKGYAIYNDITRMGHSCLPNCARANSGRDCVVRLIRPVWATS